MIKKNTSKNLLTKRSRQLSFVFTLLIVFLGLGSGSSEPNITKSLMSPDWHNLMGFDSLGRPLLARVAWGTLNSFGVASGGAVIAILVGVFFGSLFSIYLRKFDSLTIKTLDILNTIPNFVYVVVLGGLLWNWPPILRLIISTGLVHWIIVARTIRLKFMELQGQEFIIAAQALGASRMRLILRHLLPQCQEEIGLLAINQFSAILSQEAFISFIGFGFSPPQTSLGLLLQEGWRMLAVSPHLVFGPGITLMLLLYSLYSLRMEKFSRPN